MHASIRSVRAGFRFRNGGIRQLKTDDGIPRYPESFRGARLLNPPRSAQIGDIGIGCFAIRDG